MQLYRAFKGTLFLYLSPSLHAFNHAL